MIFITDEKELIAKNSYVIYFYTAWIPYNKKMTLMLEKFESQYPKIKFFAVNCDDYKNICKRFSIDSVPSILIVKRNAFKKTDIKVIKGLVLNSVLKNVFTELHK